MSRRFRDSRGPEDGDRAVPRDDRSDERQSRQRRQGLLPHRRDRLLLRTRVRDDEVRALGGLQVDDEDAG